MRIGLATERTCTVSAAAAIRRLYIKAGLEPPGRFLWLPSPREFESAERYHRDSLEHSVVDRFQAMRAVLCMHLEAVGDGSGVFERLQFRVDDSVRATLARRLARELDHGPVHSCLWGQHEAPWIALGMWLRVSRPESIDAGQRTLLDAWADVAQRCGWWWPYRDTCIVSDRPCHISWTAAPSRSLLPRPSDASVQFRDGWGIHVLSGVEVERRIVARPREISIAEICDERDLDRRRVLMDQYGVDRFLLHANARVVHTDDYGILYRCTVGTGEDIAMVEVRNSTPEPDGTHKRYLLRVAPWLETAHQAVAWTFGLSATEYALTVET